MATLAHDEYELMPLDDGYPNAKNDEKTTDKSTKNNNNKRLILTISVILLIITAVSIMWIGIHFDFWKIDSNSNDSNSNKNELLTSYVLGNDSIEITKESDDTLKGIFTVLKEYEYEYEFISISNGTFDFISFVTTSSKKHIYGFRIERFDAANVVFTFYENGVAFSGSPVMTNETTADVDTNEFAVFMEEHLGEDYALHFVELSVKLGSIGYLGTRNKAIGDIHNFANWIATSTRKNDKIDIGRWPDLTGEYEKTNTIVFASKNAGFWVTTMDELMKYTSSDQSKNSGQKNDEISSLTSSRSLLGNCGLTSACDNSCFGECGDGCNCWSWKCDDCNCWAGCKEHDYYCSCESMFHWCCINVFWVQCGGGGLDVWYYPKC